MMANSDDHRPAPLRPENIPAPRGAEEQPEWRAAGDRSQFDIICGWLTGTGQPVAGIRLGHVAILATFAAAVAEAADAGDDALIRRLVAGLRERIRLC